MKIREIFSQQIGALLSLVYGQLRTAPSPRRLQSHTRDKENFEI